MARHLGGSRWRRLLPSQAMSTSLARCGRDATDTASPLPAKTTVRLTARGLVQRLSRTYDLPRPRENTDFCREAGCVQLITTDTVSVSQWPTEAAAARYARVMRRTGPVEAVGVFVLSWAGRRQVMPEQVRERMLADAQKIAESAQ